MDKKSKQVLNSQRVVKGEFRSGDFQEASLTKIVTGDCVKFLHALGLETSFLKKKVTDFDKDPVFWDVKQFVETWGVSVENIYYLIS